MKELKGRDERVLFRGIVCTTVLLLALALSPAEAQAHAKLTRSSPEAGAKLAEPPAAVELWFTDELERSFGSIEVKDANGRRVDAGEVSHGDKSARVGLKELENGRYRVVWRVLSKDGHTIKGRFSFTVAVTEPGATDGAATQPQSPPPGSQTDETVAPVHDDAPPPADAETGKVESAITWTDSLVRWLSYLAMMTVFGGFVFRLFLLAPALGRSSGDDDQAGAPFEAGVRRTVLVMWAGVVLLIATTFASLVLQAANISGGSLAEALSPSLLWRVLTGTGYGLSWLVQAASALALLVVMFLVARGTGGVSLWWAGLVAGAALLLAPSLTGHTAASSEEFQLATLSDWLHLLAGGVWFGGLLHFGLAAPSIASRVETGRLAHVLGRMISGFTRIAVPSVLVVAAAGLYNSWVQVGSLDALVATSYGNTLLIKLALVGVMLLLGGLHNFYFGRRAARIDENEASRSSDEGEALSRKFSRSLALEVVAGVLVLLVTAILVFQTPARTSHNNVSGATQTGEPGASD